MSDDPGSEGANASAETVEWPVPLEGVTESVVTTLGPNGRWNAAALGLFGDDDDDDDDRGPVTATTWGNTRTRRNFHRQGEGYVQFTVDPIAFVDAALSIHELEEPVLDSANAWVRVRVEQVDSGTEEETGWEKWELHPLESEIVSETVPTIDRGFGAVIEATVAVSRLGVEGYDEGELRERLGYCASVVDRAGSKRERDALERVREYSEW
ncbi:DUF447 domain-containing protein [Natronococcus pandeyae]|uniref:DUF447 domain-containing protein n=1 Tax=Natronococcus pandeyae TaxID=2055836 RepID=A0A8J8Q3D8_9EURY|nr:DUF447 domain-containing protein [Natronococcus pandeyae]TYL38656.1 DUF447 domain-containing protein [Natronococcus pandeyae]